MGFESFARKPAPKPEKPTKPIELSEEDIELVEEPEEITGVFKKQPAEAEELSEADIIEEREPGELQESDVIGAFEVNGFKGLKVTATLEKKDERKGNAEDRNQDNIIADPETGLVGVLDGLGGEGAGDLASKSAEGAIPAQYKTALERTKAMNGADVQTSIVERQLKRLNVSDPAKSMEIRKGLTTMVEDAMSKDPALGRKALALLESVNAANAYVKETGGKTTACVGFVHETPSGERYAVVANIGDSAAYKQRANGEMVPLTQEDSLLNVLNQSGAIAPDLYAKMKAAPDQKFPIPVPLETFRALGAGEKEYEAMEGKIPLSYKKLKASMAASLGAESSEATLSIRQIKKGEKVYFGTDGLVDKFEDPTTEETDLALLAKESAKGLDGLRKAAKERKTYKTDDDIALVEVSVE
jgi:serine/threonine protein phosphatase PrpC